MSSVCVCVCMCVCVIFSPIKLALFDTTDYFFGNDTHLYHMRQPKFTQNCISRLCAAISQAAAGEDCPEQLGQGEGAGSVNHSNTAQAAGTTDQYITVNFEGSYDELYGDSSRYCDWQLIDKRQPHC